MPPMNDENNINSPMDPELSYQILRNLTSPIVAVTTSSESQRNGMIANSAIRASLLPECPRMAFYCFKRHYTHELISQSDRFCLHLIHTGQTKVVEELGFQTGRSAEKLETIDYTVNDRQMPVISDSYAYFDCDVVNSMDAGASTFFLGEAVRAGSHDSMEQLSLLTSETFRENASVELIHKYQENKKDFQEWARDHNKIQ